MVFLESIGEVDSFSRRVVGSSPLPELSRLERVRTIATLVGRADRAFTSSNRT